MNVVDKLKPYQMFESLSDMNQSIELYIYHSRMNESALRVLRVLQFRSKAVLGACWLKVATIAEVIGKSDSTVRRALRILVKLGIVKKHEQTRELSGGDGANIYTIQPFNYVDNADDHAQMTGRGAVETLEGASVESGNYESKEDSVKEEKINIKDSNKRRESFSHSIDDHLTGEKELDPSYAHHEIPSSFVRAIVPMTRDYSEINKAWKRVKIAYKNSDLSDFGLYLEDIVNDEERLFDLSKRTKSVVGGFIAGTVKNFHAVLYTTMKKYFEEVSECLAQERRKQVVNSSASFNNFQFHNWLRSETF